MKSGCWTDFELIAQCMKVTCSLDTDASDSEVFSTAYVASAILAVGKFCCEQALLSVLQIGQNNLVHCFRQLYKTQNCAQL